MKSKEVAKRIGAIISNRKNLWWLAGIKAAKIILVFLLLGCGQLHAQTIIDHLQEPGTAGEGVIKVEVSDPSINARIGRPNASATIAGFRIQVYSGNRPGVARGQADKRRDAIKEAFPDLPCYLSYNAPNWNLTVGDYISREAAALMKQKLQKQFPEFGRELFLVTEKIKVAHLLDE